MNGEVPEPWRSAMLAADAVDPRRKENVPSISALARRAGLSVETVRRMIIGEGVPEPVKVEAVARALHRAPSTVSRWVRQRRTVDQPWVPPEDAVLLNSDDRSALDRLVRVMVSDRKRMRALTDELSDAPIPYIGPRPDSPDSASSQEGDRSLEQTAAYHSPEPAGQPEPEEP